jgi:hypothetical protein
VIPKKSGGFRHIVNLKSLNKFIRYEHFKMENLETARFLLRKGDWMAKLDLKDAFQLGFLVNWENWCGTPPSVSNA